MNKLLVAAVAASTLLAGAAFAASTPATTTTSHAAATMAAATAKPATPLVPFKGAAASFKAGEGNKTATVSNKAGDWFTLSFANSCKPLDTAKSVTLSQTKTAGWLKSGKAKCKVSSFEKTAAADTTAPAAPTVPAPTAPAPVTH